jgi:ribulose-5-phosphate 4-epimerase/fuculose-1-phosphate aldolase
MSPLDMSPIDEAMAYRPSTISPEEWRARVQLAACYRMVDALGWSELIYNHITLRLPGPERHFLINPYGLFYNEVTASNLVKIDLAGNVIGKSDWPVNLAGYVIHSAIHGAREDAHCIMHTHTTAGMAVSCKKDGLKADNFYSVLLHGQFAYHEFEGITTDSDECPRLVASLGDKNMLILRHHGLLTCGATCGEALMRHWSLERACQVQMATHSMAGEVGEVSNEVLERGFKRVNAVRTGQTFGEREFNALLRRIDKIDPSYRR